MHFLPDVWITCDACGGTRYTARDPGRQVPRQDDRRRARHVGRRRARAVRQRAARSARSSRRSHDVGLGYLSLGQSAPTLSGGEAQRVKLAAELARPDTGKTLYILDEPTTGLHFDDVRKLLDVLHRLADLGNTVVVIEHNLEVIKTADWVIDLGPEAGLGGGDLVAAGHARGDRRERTRATPARFLKPVLDAGPDGRAAPVRPQGRRPRSAEGKARVAGGPSIQERPGQAGGNGSNGEIHTSPIPRPRPPGKSTAGSGIPATASPPTAGRRDGMAASSKRSSTGSRRWPARASPRPSGPNAESCGSASHDKTKISFPFFHATTSSEWVVTLRFFVPKKTFRIDPLEKQLKLVPFHQSEPPVLSDLPRLRSRPRPLPGDHDRRPRRRRFRNPRLRCVPEEGRRELPGDRKTEQAQEGERADRLMMAPGCGQDRTRKLAHRLKSDVGNVDKRRRAGISSRRSGSRSCSGRVPGLTTTAVRLESPRVLARPDARPSPPRTKARQGRITRPVAGPLPPRQGLKNPTKAAVSWDRSISPFLSTRSWPGWRPGGCDHRGRDGRRRWPCRGAFADGSGRADGSSGWIGIRRCWSWPGGRPGLPVTLIHAPYCEMRRVLDELGIDRVQGVLLDLGLSSDQLAWEGRGFSFAADGPLDMRFDPDPGGPTAADLVNRLSADDLANLIYEFGEERFSRRIARRIVEARQGGPIRTTGQLADLVRRSVPGRSRHGPIDPSTRVFQALRIAVNDELGQLDAVLRAIPEVLAPGGRAVVISFHSLEDRRAKWAFKTDPRLTVLTKKPVTATVQEVAVNPRARQRQIKGGRAMSELMSNPTSEPELEAAESVDTRTPAQSRHTAAWWSDTVRMPIHRVIRTIPRTMRLSANPRRPQHRTSLRARDDNWFPRRPVSLARSLVAIGRAGIRGTVRYPRTAAWTGLSILILGAILVTRPAKPTPKNQITASKGSPTPAENQKGSRKVLLPLRRRTEEGKPKEHVEDHRGAQRSNRHSRKGDRTEKDPAGDPATRPNSSQDSRRRATRASWLSIRPPLPYHRLPRLRQQ